MDEASFIKREMFVSVIAPMLTKPEVGVCAITTDAAESWLKDIEDFVLTKDPTYEHVKLTRVSRICTECHLKRSKDSSHAGEVVCLHQAHWKALHKDHGRENSLKDIFQAIATELDYLQEMLSIRADESGGFFDVLDVQFIKDAVPFCFQDSKSKPRFIYIGIDPSGGGKSHLSYVAVAHFLNPAIFAIIGLASFSVQGDINFSSYKATQEFVSSIRRAFPSTPIYVACEDRPYGICDHIAQAVVCFKDTIFLTAEHSRQHGIGINMVPATKSKICSNLARVVKHRLLRFASNIVCLTNLQLSFKGTEFPTVKDFMIHKFLREMCNVSIDAETQQISGKKNGMNDDLFMAMAMSMFCEFWIRDDRVTPYVPALNFILNPEKSHLPIAIGPS